jgi:hypothetical protein
LRSKQAEYEQAMSVYSRALAVLEAGYGPEHIEVGSISEARAGRARSILLLFFFPFFLLFSSPYSSSLLSSSCFFFFLFLLLLVSSSSSSFLLLIAVALQVAEVLNSLGLVEKKRANYDAAEKLYTRAIAIVVKTFGKKHYKYGVFQVRSKTAAALDKQADPIAN